jgi:Mg2+-importing ATPase
MSVQSDEEPAFWQQNLTALLEYHKSTPDGLESNEAASYLKHYGPNVFHPQRKNAKLLQFLSKFNNPLIIILLVASAISAFTGDVTNFIIR